MIKMRFWQNELEEMDFRLKLGQRLPRWRIILAPICWITHRHAWRSVVGYPNDGGSVDTAKCKICEVFYHMWW